MSVDLSIKIGDTVPEGSFQYIPFTPELDDQTACGVPTTLDITKEWKGKRVVLFSVPGAFTPTCHVNHLPGYIAKYDELKAKGVDIVAVVASNDAFVMSGWGRVEGVKDKILTLSDPNVEWSTKLGLSTEIPNQALKARTKRFAMVIDNLVVKYLGVESQKGVSVSGAEAVLAGLQGI